MTKPLTAELRTDVQDRLSSLDIARSFAAIAVVFWHWQHFLFTGYTLPATFDGTTQPLYSVLSPFYEGGWFAVDFFFMLSGFIFFWKYRASISEGAVSAWPFFVLRVSRLYPLHLLTLLLVAALQAVYAARYGTFFVFPFNDLYHFVLQLFLASHWGLERGPSFNDPVWSLSIEVVLYAMFFCVARLTAGRWPLLASLSVLGFILYASNASNALGRGIFCFFIGGMLVYAFAATRSSQRWPILEKAVYITTPATVIILLAVWRLGLIDWAAQSLAALATSLRPGLAPLQEAIAGRLSRVLAYGAVTALLFPALIAALVVLERRYHRHIHRWSFIGNISYSSYLLHIPLQIACVLLFPTLFRNPAIASSGIAMLAFLIVLIALSFASYYWVERPAQTLIRRRVLGPVARTTPESEIHSRVLQDHLADPAPAPDIAVPR